MSTNSLALSSAGNWRNRNENNCDRQQRRRSSVLRALYDQQEESSGMYQPWRLFEERVRTGPFGLVHFPSQPHSPARIFIVDSSINGQILNPRLQQFIHESPPRIRHEWQLGTNPDPVPAILTDAAFNTAMKKIRKQAYAPPKYNTKAWKRGLFSKRNSSSNEEKNEIDEQCTVCLEFFVLREQVLVTPCNHLFHNDCLVPWLRSHGRCPVCRFKLCENEVARAPNYSNFSNAREVYDDDNPALDLVALVRAMEEAFAWMHLNL